MMVNIIKAEFYKLKHTGILPLHIVVPLAYSFLYFLLIKTTTLKNYSDSDLIEYFFVLLGGGFPILISVITAKFVDLEETAGNFQLILSSEKSRAFSYLGKFLVIILLGLFSSFLAIFSFYFLFGRGNFTNRIILGTLCRFSTIFIYSLHLFLAFRVSRAVSIGLGFFESLVGFLSMTVLGDILWYYIPSSWPLRIPASFLKINLLGSAFVKAEFLKSLKFAPLITGLGLIFSLVRFSKWEGENFNE